MIQIVPILIVSKTLIKTYKTLNMITIHSISSFHVKASVTSSAKKLHVLINYSQLKCHCQILFVSIQIWLNLFRIEKCYKKIKMYKNYKTTNHIKITTLHICIKAPNTPNPTETIPEPYH